MIGNRDIYLDRTKVNTFSLQLNHCGIQECTPGYSYGFEANPYHLIHFLLNGGGFLEINHRLINIHAGQAFYIPPGTPARYCASLETPWTYGWIGFYSNTSNPFIALLFENQNVISFKMPVEEVEKNLLSVIAVTDKRVSEYSQYNESDFYGEQFTAILKVSDSLRANSRMLDFFSDLLSFQVPDKAMRMEKDSLALRAKEFMDSHYHEPLKIYDIAASLNTHPNYLCAVFKKEYGQTPGDYLCSIRMAQAAMILKLTDHTISMIAESLGYANPFRFSAAFKSYYGVSPSAYRKEGR